MEWGWYRASCLSWEEILDNRSGSSYYHGNKICPQKVLAPPDFGGAGALTNTLTNTAIVLDRTGQHRVGFSLPGADFSWLFSAFL